VLAPVKHVDGPALSAQGVGIPDNEPPMQNTCLPPPQQKTSLKAAVPSDVSAVDCGMQEAKEQKVTDLQGRSTGLSSEPRATKSVSAVPFSVFVSILRTRWLKWLKVLDANHTIHIMPVGRSTELMLRRCERQRTRD
jgi:hypothetical protein